MNSISSSNKQRKINAYKLDNMLDKKDSSQTLEKNFILEELTKYLGIFLITQFCHMQIIQNLKDD